MLLIGKDTPLGTLYNHHTSFMVTITVCVCLCYIYSNHKSSGSGSRSAFSQPVLLKKIFITTITTLLWCYCTKTFTVFIFGAKLYVKGYLRGKEADDVNEQRRMECEWTECMQFLHYVKKKKVVKSWEPIRATKHMQSIIYLLLIW